MPKTISTKPSKATESAEAVVAIYKCLCDVNRLRILNLLYAAPQCVCHLEAVLGIGAVRTSQHLAYMKRHDMVVSSARGTWRVYSLPEKRSSELNAHLACLQDCVFGGKAFRSDLAKLEKIRSSCNAAPHLNIIQTTNQSL